MEEEEEEGEEGHYLGSFYPYGLPFYPTFLYLPGHFYYIYTYKPALTQIPRLPSSALAWAF